MGDVEIPLAGVLHKHVLRNRREQIFFRSPNLATNNVHVLFLAKFFLKTIFDCSISTNNALKKKKNTHSKIDFIEPGKKINAQFCE